MLIIQKILSHTTMTKKHQQTLTRAAIRDAFHQKLDLNQEESGVLLESIFDELKTLIIKGSYVKIMAFGTFLVHTKKARVGRNPKTKVETMITPRKSVSFRPSLTLRTQVNGEQVAKEKLS